MWYTHMDLTTIRNLDYYDFQVHLRIAMIKEAKDREFKMALQGIDPKKKKKPLTKKDFFGKKTLRQRFDPETNSFVEN